MVPVRSVALLGLLAMMSVSGAEPPAPAGPRATRVVGQAVSHAAPAKKKRYVVAAIGDSITDRRVGGGKYMKKLAARCPGSRFDAYGVGGQRVFHMRARWEEELFGKGRPRYTDLVLLGGINDFVAGFVDDARLASMKSDLRAMYEGARARGIRVVALTVPLFSPYSGHEKKMNDALAEFILDQPRTGSVSRAIDIRPMLLCGQPQSLCKPYRHTPGDMIHWSDRGHEVVADALYRAAFSDCD